MMKNDFCCKCNMYWNFLKEADGFKRTNKAVLQNLQKLYQTFALSRLGLLIFWLDTTKENLVVVTFVLF